MVFSICVLSLVLAILVVCLVFQFIQQEPKPRQPNIVFIVADDLGWNDVGWHNSEMQTPNLDGLARNGIVFNQSYMQYMCTPSRSAFMTGYFPYRTGMQHGVIWRVAGTGLPMKFAILPEKLKELGYETHLVGKWHLGHCHWNYTPTYRGFDSFLGAYAGATTYFTHQLEGNPTALDFHNGTETLTTFDGVYSSIPFLEQIGNILSKHSASKPLFLYLPFTLPHSPLEVPKEYLRKHANVTNEKRRTYNAMVSALDDIVGRTMDLLREFELYENSVIVFTSDNGGQVYQGGSNFPLRGNKNTLFEGGMRVAGFLHSPFLSTTGFVYNGMIHAVDWFTTFLTLAGGKPDPDVDGMDVWKSVVDDLPSPRKEFVYNMDNWNSSSINGAIRVGDWKLIFGKTGLPDDRFTPDNVTDEYAAWAMQDYLLGRPDSPYYHLFNIIDDPYEEKNLASTLPDKVDELMKRVQELVRSKLVEPIWAPNDPKGIESIEDGILEPDYCEPIRSVIPSRESIVNSEIPIQ